MSAPVYLSASELLTASKHIGSIESSSEKEFATFQFTIGGEKIHIKATGVVGGEVKASQFNAGKLQLTLDISGDGMLMFAAEQVKREVQAVLDTECLPDMEVTVTSWVKNKIVYLSWPKGRRDYGAVTVNGDAISQGTPAFDRLQAQLRKIGGVNDKVEVGFSLYAWIRYGKDQEGKPNSKITVGFSPQLEYMNFKE